MKHILVAAALAFTLSLTAELAVAADVTVKAGEKTAKAKVGQSIKLELPNTPPPEAGDIKVTVEGEAIDKETTKTAEVIKENGKPVSGKGSAAVVLKAKAAGTSKVKVEFKADGKNHTHEYQVEVTN